MKKVLNKKIPAKKIVSKKLPAVKSIDKPKKTGWLGFLALANVILFAAVIVINYLATSLPIGGMTTGELSDLYPNLFTPAGLTFSIRGLIYLALTGFVIRQIIDLYRKKSVGITQKIGIWFLLSCATNIGWIFAWHYKIVRLSVIIMILFLVILIVISNKVLMGKKLGNRGDKLLVQIPFSLYLGRISVATIANVSTFLVNIGWNARGLSDIFWTTVVIVVAALLALISMYKKYNVIFALVVIRAFIGIIIKRVSVDPVYASSIIWTLGVCIAVISAGIGWRLDKWIKN